MTATRTRTVATSVTAEKMRLWASEAMRRQFLHLRNRGKARGAATPEEFYGFNAGDVTDLYFHKHGFGRGLWFRLKDGRVIDFRGQPSQPDRAWYVAPAH